ncbi:hypothetical protein [Amycolatopsis japonica]|nr:hypothetical protein [Amycolatopsis japonica]
MLPDEEEKHGEQRHADTRQDFGFVKLTEIVDPAGNKVTFVWENPSPE